MLSATVQQCNSATPNQIGAILEPNRDSRIRRSWPSQPALRHVLARTLPECARSPRSAAQLRRERHTDLAPPTEVAHRPRLVSAVQKGQR